MKQFDFGTIERSFFKGGDPTKRLLKISLDLFEARQTGILYGTNHSKNKFLPTSMWDRGIMDKFDGRGLKGLILKLFGTQIVTARKLSPVFFYKPCGNGKVQDNDGIISYVLRNCANYYKKGISVIICPDTDKYIQKTDEKYLRIPFFSYDGNSIEKPKDAIKVDYEIVKHFNSRNSIYIYLPDYGILVINTANVDLLETKGSKFVRQEELTQRLDVLIKLVETSSLVSLGQLTGKKGSRLLWRKERHLRKTSHELIENEMKYRDLYENAPIAYISMNPKGEILKCNKKAEVLSGYEENDLIGQNANDFFVEQKKTARGAMDMWGTLAGGEAIKDHELQIKPKKGKSIWVSLSIEGVKDKLGKIIELRAMAVDISQRKGLEKQLFQAQKMEAIGTLAGGIAHDFNNILSPISGYTEMLLMDVKKDDPEKKQLEVILDCAKHAKELVSQILTFSKQKEYEYKIISAEEVIKESMSLLRSFLSATIKINIKIENKCGYILADPVQIHQVIINLVTNANYAMEKKGGTIDISISKVKNIEKVFLNKPVKKGSYICLSIKDTGTGIDSKNLDKIFEPYYSTKKAGKGSGVGLSVVHGIVESHNGYIKVESDKEKGTRFDIYFPKCRRYTDIEIETADDMPIQKGTERVLLVDDDKKVAVMETHMLEKLGYTVTCFTNSLKAIDFFENNPEIFDAVVTDLSMPDLSGIQLAGKIFDIKSDLPIILCTGLGDIIEKKNFESLSIKGFLKKPVAIKELSHTLRKVLDE